MSLRQPHVLNHINIQVLRSYTLWRLVAGYGATPLDRLAFSGFLMGQVAHQQSALSTAVALTVLSLERPADLEARLDRIFRGWAHGRETPPLINVRWDGLWRLRLDQVRELLHVMPFASGLAVAGPGADGQAPPS